MAHYVDKSTQTLIEGLARNPAPRPPALGAPIDTPTPPDDMAVDKVQMPAGATHATPPTTLDNHSSPALLLGRKSRPPLVARITMPYPDLDAEDPCSPPPTQALFSPLPAANRLHAGHTPIIPRALSPLPPEDSGPPTPEQDVSLSGPLTLPPQPGDGAADTITLNVLDAELEKLRLEQEREEQRSTSPPNAHHMSPNLGKPAEGNMQRGAHMSPVESQRPEADETEVVVDGVLLKKPKMNLGAPLGQA